MAIIYSYPLNTPKREDLLIGTVTYDENAQDPVVGNPTVSFTVGSLLDLVAAQGAAQNLQQVTNIGNTTTNSIVISNSLKVAGGYYDSSNQPGTSGQILSSTATGTQWVNVAAQGVTSVGLSMPAAFTVTNSPITQSGTLTVTGAGTAAQYINGLGNLVTFPTIPAPYVLPVATTVALGGIKIGYTEAGKNYPLELDNEQAYVNVPWTDTVYSLPLAADGTRGGVQIGYVENAKNYPVELSSEKMFVNVPWTDTTYTLPVATATDLGGVKIGYTENAKNYPVELDSDQMYVNVPWTDTQTVQTITGTGSDNTDSGVLLSDSGGTVLILGSGSVAASQTGNTITLTGTDTGVTGVTLATGTSTGAPLSESIANRELTLTSFEYDGGSNIGYVPAGGTATTYLKGDGSWGSIPTGLQFKGTWDASGGGGGNPDLTQGANKGAGFLWICDVAGTAYPNGGTNPPSTWNLGDWAVYDGTAWTRVPATNSGVTSLTTTDGTFINLTPNAATTGAVTVTADLSAQDGTSDTNTRFLSKDNTWDVPSYTTNTQNIYTNSWQQSSNDIILRKVLSGAGSGTQDIKIVKGANITFTYTDANNFTIAATNTQENTTWTVRDSNDDDKTVNNLKYLKFVTATGALDTALTGAGSTSDPYIMTLTSPDTNTQNTYTAGAGLSVSNFVFSADIDTTAASSATNNLSTDSGRYYAVQLDNNSTAADRKMVVNVPWSSGGTYNWTIKDNATNPASSVVDSGETIQFVTATGPLGTVLTEPTTGNFVMTLTSPDTTTNTTYDLAGAADGSVAANYNLVLSADGTAQDTMVFKEGSNVTFTRATNSLTIAADNDNTTYDFLAVQTGNPATNDDPALRLDPSTGSNDDVTLTGGSNMTITRDSNTEITFDATNTWNANTKTVAGYVAAPGAVADKVWKTDGSGNPAWRDDSTGPNNTYTLTSAGKVITLNDTSTSTAAGTVTFVDGSDISISSSTANEITITNDSPDSGLPAVLTDGANPGVTSLYANTTAAAVRATIGAGTGDGLVTSLTTTGTSGAATLTNGVLNIPEYTEADTLATVTARGDTTTTKSYFNGDLEVKNEITVSKTDVNTPGKITINGNTDATLQLKSEDTALAANETLGVIEFYGSDGTAPGAGVKSSIRARNGDQVGGTGDKSNLIFAVSDGTSNNNEALRINPTGSIAIDGATKYGASGQVLTSAGDAPPTWEDAPTGDNFYVTGASYSGGTLTLTRNGNLSDLTATGFSQGDITGTGSAGRVAFWTSATNISNDSAFEWDNTNNRLSINGPIITDPVNRGYTVGVNGNIQTSSFRIFSTNPQVGVFELQDDGNHAASNGPGKSLMTIEGNTPYATGNPWPLVAAVTSFSGSGSPGSGYLNSVWKFSGSNDGSKGHRAKVTIDYGLGIGYLSKHVGDIASDAALQIVDGLYNGGGTLSQIFYVAKGTTPKVGIGTNSPSGLLHIKSGSINVFYADGTCGNVGIKLSNADITSTQEAAFTVKGNMSYAYTNYTQIAFTYTNVIDFNGFPAGVYQLNLCTQSNASSYGVFTVKWSGSAGTVINTLVSGGTNGGYGLSFSGTVLRSISNVNTDTAANLQCLVTYETCQP